MSYYFFPVVPAFGPKAQAKQAIARKSVARAVISAEKHGTQPHDRAKSKDDGYGRKCAFFIKKKKGGMVGDKRFELLTSSM